MKQKKWHPKLKWKLEIPDEVIKLNFEMDEKLKFKPKAIIIDKNGQRKEKRESNNTRLF